MKSNFLLELPRAEEAPLLWLLERETVLGAGGGTGGGGGDPPRSSASDWDPSSDSVSE